MKISPIRGTVTFKKSPALGVRDFFLGEEEGLIVSLMFNKSNANISNKIENKNVT